MNYQVREGKKTFPSQVGSDFHELWVNEVLAACEVGASEATKKVMTQVPRALSGNRKRDLPGCGWFIGTRVSLLFPSLPPPTFSFPLTFTLEDDRWSDCDLTLKSCGTRSLSYVAHTRKLSSDWQSVCYLLNLSACVILANAFAPKKSPLSGSGCSGCWYFSPGVIRQEKNETVSLGLHGFDNILSWGLL